MLETSYNAILGDMTVRALWEVQNVIDCIPDAIWEKPYGGRPLWQHVYHMLRKLDQWFINPRADDGIPPPLQDDVTWPAGPDSGGTAPQGTMPLLSRREVNEYFYAIKSRLSLYLTSLHDEDLLQRPAGCEWTRFTLMLAQFRQLHMHMGMVMGFVLAETGLCPRVTDLENDIPKGPYHPYF